MSNLLVSGMPSNLRRDDFGSLYIEGDLYNIADRIRELASNVLGHKERLVIRDRTSTWLEYNKSGYRYVISEICEDGVERWVMGRNELDGRLISDLEEMLYVPFEKRWAEAEKREQAIKDQHEADELDRLAETIGLPMLTDLERTGFIQRPISYPKRGHVGGKGGLRRERGGYVLPKPLKAGANA